MAPLVRIGGSRHTGQAAPPQRNIQTAVDKDLLFPGNKVYSPETCCILPQTLNTMLSNCKKHRLPKWKKAKMNLPLGVRYDSGLKMYYAQIKLCDHDEVINLSYHKTAGVRHFLKVFKK